MNQHTADLELGAIAPADTRAITPADVDLGAIAPADWDANYTRRYQETTYGQSHQQNYLDRRSRALAALAAECRLPGQTLRVLEVACGPGLSLAHLSHLPSPVRLTGIDMSQHMLQLASANLAGAKPSLARASARRLPFRDESFDFVYATRFIHLFPDKAPIVEELKRVTRRGGLLALEFYPRPFHLLHYLARLARGKRTSLGEYLFHFPRLATVRAVMGETPRYVPLRFGAERWWTRLLESSRLEKLLRGSWRSPLRLALAEYLAIIRRT